MFAERRVDQVLIAAACGVHLLSEPSEYVLVQADRDRVLPRGTATIAPRFPILKSYSFLMVHPSYCRRSFLVALLAEIIRILSVRPVKTTIRNPRRPAYAQLYIYCNQVTGRLPGGA